MTMLSTIAAVDRIMFRQPSHEAGSELSRIAAIASSVRMKDSSFAFFIAFAVLDWLGHHRRWEGGPMPLPEAVQSFFRLDRIHLTALIVRSINVATEAAVPIHSLMFLHTVYLISVYIISYWAPVIKALSRNPDFLIEKSVI